MTDAILANEYIPLNKVRDMLEASGVYEILCLKTNRVYIGQSRAIINRAAAHFHDLRAGRHSNNALQDDWNRVADPAVFVFKIVQHLDPMDEKQLLKYERKEIERRRKYGVDLYNDIRVIKVVESESKPKPQKTEQQGRDYGNKPYARSYSYTTPADSATCTGCGLIGIINQHLFRLDGELRCERCIDKHSRRLEEWLRKERERVAREELQVSRITSRFKMRWQVGIGSMKNNIIQASARYVSKYGQFPQEAHFNIGCELPEVKDLEVKHHKHTPPGFIDFPEPSRE
jgi:GIY-YIG catalytic domain